MADKKTEPNPSATAVVRVTPEEVVPKITTTATPAPNRRFIVIVPAPADAEPMVYPEGHPKAGQPIEDWQGKPIVDADGKPQKGFIWKNRDESLATAAANGDSVIFINGLSSRQEARLMQVIAANGGDTSTWTKEKFQALIDFIVTPEGTAIRPETAEILGLPEGTKGLGGTDAYNSTRAGVVQNLVDADGKVAHDLAKNGGVGYKAGTPIKAAYMPGNIHVDGKDPNIPGGQRHTNGALITVQESKGKEPHITSVDSEMAIRDYRGPDGKRMILFGPDRNVAVIDPKTKAVIPVGQPLPPHVEAQIKADIKVANARLTQKAMEENRAGGLVTGQRLTVVYGTPDTPVTGIAVDADQYDRALQAVDDEATRANNGKPQPIKVTRIDHGGGKVTYVIEPPKGVDPAKVTAALDAQGIAARQIDPTAAARARSADDGKPAETSDDKPPAASVEEARAYINNDPYLAAVKGTAPGRFAWLKSVKAGKVVGATGIAMVSMDLYAHRDEIIDDFINDPQQFIKVVGPNALYILSSALDYAAKEGGSRAALPVAAAAALWQASNAAMARDGAEFSRVICGFVGAVGVGAAGAIIGSPGGPWGSAAGGLIGAIAGGIVSSEYISPTFKEKAQRWLDNFNPDPEYRANLVKDISGIVQKLGDNPNFKPSETEQKRLIEAKERLHGEVEVLSGLVKMMNDPKHPAYNPEKSQKYREWLEMVKMQEAAVDGVLESPNFAAGKVVQVYQLAQKQEVKEAAEAAKVAQGRKDAQALGISGMGPYPTQPSAGNMR